MSDINNNLKIKQTADCRHERIEKLKEFIKEKKKLPITEVYKYALNGFGIGIRTIDIYLKELAFMGAIKLNLNDYGQPQSVEYNEEST